MGFLHLAVSPNLLSRIRFQETFILIIHLYSFGIFYLWKHLTGALLSLRWKLWKWYKMKCIYLPSGHAQSSEQDTCGLSLHLCYPPLLEKLQPLLRRTSVAYTVWEQWTSKCLDRWKGYFAQIMHKCDHYIYILIQVLSFWSRYSGQTSILK